MAILSSRGLVLSKSRVLDQSDAVSNQVSLSVNISAKKS